MFRTDYNDSNSDDILRHAKQLEKHSLREYLTTIGNFENYKSKPNSKGSFGNEIEEFFFGYKPNSTPEPDFQKVGLELKVTPLKHTGNDKLTPKERLVLSMIDYCKLAEETWDNNSIIKKLKFLLLMFYVYEKDIKSIDYIFELICTWKPSDEDLEIIKRDWHLIAEKVRNGKAHEISEGDTLYLGACTKAADSSKRTKQPFCDEPAKPRAFSLKQSYMKAIWNELNGNISVPLAPKVDFQRVVIEKFKRLYGNSIGSIAHNLEIELPGTKRPKDFISIFMKKAQIVLFEKQLEEFNEFEKSGIRVKCIVLKPSGIPKEDMSFPYIKYEEIISQEWDSSEIKDMFENEKHLWLIFRASKNYSKQKDLSYDEIIFEKAMFWNIPYSDLENEISKVWQDTVAKIRAGDYEHFIKSSENRVSHIRPKGQTAKDLMRTPQGTYEKKKCFWLNRKYIAEQIVKNED